ncbi:type III secretion protein [Pseudomonas capsici]|uniref:HrpO n=2 Tax=Pseudomonas TaxID=286 RepID=Q20IQ9_PSECI|nr:MULTISPECIES: type III secretion protein [Pseudomonas]ABA47276.1 HrpO [Pseudomonas cichorii]MBN6716060.1 type III secretion protein [Pseudomonas capsici]MBN6720989.1 type III secretion protein [Pseudomonas capsici]MBN6726180.1 type III secretion protein [Pseudomonas capsici]MBX8477110.1 type III secretion protein [Pseudomonas cichorii]
MSHDDLDLSDSANDPQMNTLGQTLDILAPIRRHRLTLAEQAWRRQNQVLNELQTRLHQMTQDLESLHQAYRQSRIEQRERHANRPLPLSEMNDWLAQERQAIRHIERNEKHLSNLQHEHRQQQMWTEDSHTELRKRQRDVEKLDYLMDLAREAS